MTAKRIRAIGAPDGETAELIHLLEKLQHNVRDMPYGYLDQILRRCEAALLQVKDVDERELLEEMQRSALWRIQRVHMESRP